MGDLLAFRDPSAPLEGAARDAALNRYRAVCPELVDHALGKVFSRSFKVADAGGLSVYDALEVFAEAVRSSLEQRGM